MIEQTSSPLTDVRAASLAPADNGYYNLRVSTFDGEEHIYRVDDLSIFLLSISTRLATQEVHERLGADKTDVRVLAKDPA